MITRSPLLWGGLAAVAFFWAIDFHVVESPFLKRYCAGHPVEYAETAMFFVGLAALLIKLVEAMGQHRVLRIPLLGSASRGGQPVSDCDRLLQALDALPATVRDSLLVQRMRGGLEHVRFRGSADRLDDELRYLSELESDRVQASFALEWIIIWAIPILGFLGTVIGITMAIASLSPEQLEQSLNEVLAGLGVAFDTTTLALTLSIVLMFTKFFVDRVQGNLLDKIDARAEAELVGRFEATPPEVSGDIAVVRRMAETVVDAVETLVARQADLWQHSLEESQRRWTALTSSAGETLQRSLAAGLQASLEGHAQRLVEWEQALAAKQRQSVETAERNLATATQALTGLQSALSRQAEILTRAVEATAEVTRLEDVLNRNLAALAGAGRFEETVVSLAAAIQLLSARLGHVPGDAHAVQLTPKRNQAA